MKKDFVVTFGANGAHIKTGINVRDWDGVPNVAVNPDLSGVKGIPPHLWKLEQLNIVPCADNTSNNVARYEVSLKQDFLTELAHKYFILTVVLVIIVDSILHLLWH